MKISKNLTELVGNTPLLYLEQYSRETGAENAELIVKLEYFNPLGSVKDRAALAMIDEAEKSGKLKSGSVIIEPTSGNTGIGLAFVATARGYRIILTMPESMSLERRKLLMALGAELVLTPSSLGMKGAIAEAEKLAAETPNSFFPGSSPILQTRGSTERQQQRNLEGYRRTGGYFRCRRSVRAVR